MNKLSMFFNSIRSFLDNFPKKYFSFEKKNFLFKPVCQIYLHRESYFLSFVSELEKEDVKGIYYFPLDEKDPPSLCVLKKDKKTFFSALHQYVRRESLQIKTKKKNFLVSCFMWLNIKHEKDIDIQILSTRNLTSELNSFWFKLELWEEHRKFYKAPVRNYISMKLWKSLSSEYGFFVGKKIHDYSSVLRCSHESSVSFDIDLVFTWVNSNDISWQNMYKNYSPKITNDANTDSRFLSRDELKYSLRSWSKYGSFIRRIYIVSNCKPPEWLNLDHENINWVAHEDIIPIGCLPTFNSHAIEARIHKIKGLSNYFVYCNDDVFLGRPTKASDFYQSNGIAKIRLESYGNVSGRINKKHPDYLNAARNSNNLLETEFGKTVTQLHTHSPSSLRVDVLDEMNEKFLKEFSATTHSKFRSISDINVTSFLAPHYLFLSGKAINSSSRTDLIQQNHKYKKKFRKYLKFKNANDFDKLPLSFCLNDGGDSHSNPLWNKGVINFLDAFFPDKSDFEN